MEKHMIFFDIDGTLLDDETNILPDSTIRAIRQARKNGQLVFICTGRCQAIWPENVMNIGFDGVIGGCGTQIMYEGKEILHKVLSKALQAEVADALVQYHVDGVLEGVNASYFRHDYWMPVVKRIFEENGTFSPICQSFWDDEALDFDKMALWFDSSSDMMGFKAEFQDRFDFILRDPTFYEVVPKGYSKASGIEYLCNTLGISPKNTIGIGDSTNDLPMLNYTGISIAMGSGNPDIFSVVDYVTDTVLNDGIEKALKKYDVI